ncbi:VCBS protein, partial [mine drainage metagenome]
VVSEFPHLVVRYPILFGKHQQTGQFLCGVMLGFIEGENQFLDPWRRDPEFYRPLMLQRSPFYALGPE